MASIQRTIELEEARADPRLHQNKEALRSLLHDENLEITIFGRSTKQQVPGDLFDSHPLIEYIMGDDQFVFFGRSSFAVSHKAREHPTFAGKVVSFECFVVAVYRKSDDK